MRFDTTRCAECHQPLSRRDIEVTGEDTCQSCRGRDDEDLVSKPCGCRPGQRCSDCYDFD